MAEKIVTIKAIEMLGDACGRSTSSSKARTSRCILRVRSLVPGKMRRGCLVTCVAMAGLQKWRILIPEPVLSCPTLDHSHTDMLASRLATFLGSCVSVEAFL